MFTPIATANTKTLRPSSPINHNRGSYPGPNWFDGKAVAAPDGSGGLVVAVAAAVAVARGVGVAVGAVVVSATKAEASGDSKIACISEFDRRVSAVCNSSALTRTARCSRLILLLIWITARRHSVPNAY